MTRDKSGNLAQGIGVALRGNPHGERLRGRIAACVVAQSGANGANYVHRLNPLREAQ